MNHIKTMLCGNFAGIDKLERLRLLQSDPLINEFNILIKEPETVSRFLGNFSYKTTQTLRGVNFRVFKKLLRESKRKSITIDIDNRVINVEGYQESAVKGYNPKKLGNNCYNLQFAFCDKLKAYIYHRICTQRQHVYRTKSTVEMIKEIVVHIETDN